MLHGDVIPRKKRVKSQQVYLYLKVWFNSDGYTCYIKSIGFPVAVHDYP